MEIIILYNVRVVFTCHMYLIFELIHVSVSIHIFSILITYGKNRTKVENVTRKRDLYLQNLFFNLN